MLTAGLLIPLCHHMAAGTCSACMGTVCLHCCMLCAQGRMPSQVQRTWWLQYRPALLQAPKANPTDSSPTSSGTLATAVSVGVSTPHASMQAAGTTKARPCASLRTDVKFQPRLTKPSATGPTYTLTLQRRQGSMSLAAVEVISDAKHVQDLMYSIRLVRHVAYRCLPLAAATDRW